jgi:enoyl-CoA hydratase
MVTVSLEDGFAWIRIENPPVNAMSLEGFQQLNRCLEEIEQNPSVRVVFLTAAGSKAFVAGIDIRQAMSFTEQDMVEFNRVSRKALDRIESLKQPVVAVVGGAAYGAGFELALACDFRIAAEGAVFALPELNLGIIPGGGGTQRLTRLIGEARSKECILLGRPLTAGEAKALGLVHDVVPGDSLREAALKLGRELAKRAPIALAEAKRVIHQAMDVPLDQGLDLEADAFMTVFRSADAKEGMQAFAEKRAPVFQGK